MVVDSANSFIPLTAAKTHKFVIVSCVKSSEIFLRCHSLLLPEATDGMIQVVVYAVCAVILTAAA